MAVAKAAREDDRASIPNLILELESTDPAQRMLAIGALERLTGQTHGFEYWAPRPVRDEAIARWKAWWQSQGQSPPPSSGHPSDGPGMAQASSAAPSP